LEPTIIFTKKVAIFSALAIYVTECFLIWRQSRARTLAQGHEDAANKRSRSWQTNSALLLYLVSVESVALDAVPWLWHLVEAYQIQYLPSFGSEFWKSSLFLLACGLIWMAIDSALSLLRMWFYKGESSADARPVWRWSNVWIDAVNGKPVPAVLLLFCFNTVLFKALGGRLGGNWYFALTMVEINVPFVLYPIYFQSRIQQVSQLEDGELRLSIEGTASEIKFPLKNIHIITGPLEGLEKGVQLIGWPRKNSICVHEALLSSLSNDEITGLVASRLGNWKRCVSLITYGFSMVGSTLPLSEKIYC
jgi:STE24 endopeptidase